MQEFRRTEGRAGGTRDEGSMGPGGRAWPGRRMVRAVGSGILPPSAQNGASCLAAMVGAWPPFYNLRTRGRAILSLSLLTCKIGLIIARLPLPRDHM